MELKFFSPCLEWLLQSQTSHVEWLSLFETLNQEIICSSFLSNPKLKIISSQESLTDNGNKIQAAFGMSLEAPKKLILEQCDWSLLCLEGGTKL